MLLKKIILSFLLLLYFLDAKSLMVDCLDIEKSTFNDRVSYFKDKNSSVNSHNVLDLNQSLFIKENHQPTHMGLSFQIPVIWGKFTSQRSCSGNQQLYLYIKNITIKDIRLFVQKKNKLHEIFTINNLSAFIFSVPLSKFDQTFYIQIIGDGPYIVDGDIHTESSLMSHIFHDLWLFALFSGIIASVVLFFAIFFLITRKRMFLYFAIHVFMHLLLWLTVFGILNIFIDSVSLSDLKFMSVSLSTVFLALLTIDFLKMQLNNPVLYKMSLVAMTLVVVYYGTAYYSSSIEFFPPVFGLFRFFLYAILLTAIVKSIKRGLDGAIFFLLGVSGFIIGNLISIVGLFATGNLPVNNFTLYAGMMGIIIDIFFISLVLAMKTRQISQEKSRLLLSYNKNLKKEVAKQTKEIQKQNKVLERLASVDTLTQMYNRMELDKKLLECYKTFQKKPKLYMSIIMIDIDHFKYVNDTHGHLAGDKILKAIALMMNDNIKSKKSTIGRWGGEEFMIICETKNAEDGLIMAERLRKKVSDYRCEIDIKLTISLGICLLKKDKSLEEWILAADEALYLAKDNGRNRIEIAE